MLVQTNKQTKGRLVMGQFKGSGEVRFPGYTSGGKLTFRGMRNRRSHHREKTKREAIRQRMIAQAKLEEQQDWED